MSNIACFAHTYQNPTQKCVARVLSAFVYPKIFWKGGFKTSNALESPLITDRVQTELWDNWAPCRPPLWLDFLNKTFYN